MSIFKGVFQFSTFVKCNNMSPCGEAMVIKKIQEFNGWLFPFCQHHLCISALSINNGELAVESIDSYNPTSMFILSMHLPQGKPQSMWKCSPQFKSHQGIGTQSLENKVALVTLGGMMGLGVCRIW